MRFDDINSAKLDTRFLMGDIEVSLTSGYAVNFDGMLRRQLSDDITTSPSNGEINRYEETTYELRRNPTEGSWSTGSDDKEDDDDEVENKSNIDNLSNFIKDLSIGNDSATEVDLLSHGPTGGAPTSWTMKPCHQNTFALNGSASVSSASQHQFQTAYQWPEHMKAAALASSVSVRRMQSSVETDLFPGQKRKSVCDENGTNIPHQFVQQYQGVQHYQCQPSMTVSGLFHPPVKFKRGDGRPVGDPQENDEMQAACGYKIRESSSTARSINYLDSNAGVRSGVCGTYPNGVILFTPVSNIDDRNDTPACKNYSTGIQVMGQSAQLMYPDTSCRVTRKKDENLEDILDGIDTAHFNNAATQLGMNEYIIPGSTVTDISSNSRQPESTTHRNVFAPADDEENLNLTSPGPPQSPADSGIIDMNYQMSPTSSVSVRQSSSSPPLLQPLQSAECTTTSSRTDIDICWSPLELTSPEEILSMTSDLLSDSVLPDLFAIDNFEPIIPVTAVEQWDELLGGIGTTEMPSSFVTSQPTRCYTTDRSATSGPLGQRNETEQTMNIMRERHEQAKAGIRVTKYTRDDLTAIDNNGDTLLHTALRTRQLLYFAEVLIFRLDRELLTESIINQRNRRTSETPLWLAASLGSSKIVELLISRKANVNAQVYEQQSLFQRAMKTQASGQQLASCSVLHHLASSGAGDASLSTLKEILKSPNVDLNSFDSAGRTALHRAVEAHGQQMIDSCGNTYNIDSTEIIRELVQHGADICQQDRVRQQTVLHWAVDQAMVLNNLNLVHHLLNLEATIISSETHGTTPSFPSVIGRGLAYHGSTVYPAVESELPATTRAVNECTGSGRNTLLHIIAAADGNDNQDNGGVVLVKTGCDVIDRRSLRMELIRLLVNHNAETLAVNAVGMTPAQLARSPEIVSMLLQGRYNAS